MALETAVAFATKEAGAKEFSRVGRWRTAIALAGLGILFAGCGSTPTGTLEGRLLGSPGLAGVPLELTPVEGEGETLEAVSNVRGRFAFEDVGHGAYRLVLQRRIEDVFECELSYPVEIREETVARRFTVSIVDIRPDGTGRVAKPGAATCRTLQDPLVALLCKARYPLVARALPPRDGSSGPAYGRVGRIRATQCESMRAVARLPGSQGVYGWLLVSLPGRPATTGWVDIFVGDRSPQRTAWTDVADAAARKLPERLPTLGGKGLPDLAFTNPRLSSNLGDACFQAGTVHVEWLMDVRNAGTGLAPKRVVVLLRDATGRSERRVLGQAGWIRGLASGESIPVGQSPPHRLGIVSYARLTIDPDDRVRESDEANNSLTTGVVPNLICR